MKTETRYKLVALLFFLVLFFCFFLQFVRPYTDAPHLRNNILIVPVFVVAGLLLVYQVLLYVKVKNTVKIFPLMGCILIFVLLVYIHWINRVENLEKDTIQYILEQNERYGR